MSNGSRQHLASGRCGRDGPKQKTPQALSERAQTSQDSFYVRHVGEMVAEAA